MAHHTGRHMETLLVRAGRDAGRQFGALNPPLVRASTVVFEGTEAYEAAGRGEDLYGASGECLPRDYSYGAAGNVTTFAFCEAFNRLHGAEETWLAPSGLAAISASLVALLNAGDHVLVPDAVYSPTRRFLDEELARFGVTPEYYAPRADPAPLFRPNTKLLLLESPGSLTFEMQDIPALAAKARAAGVLTMADNSWATPLYFRPLEHGVDIVMEALTKYISGCGDVLAGAVCAKGEAVRNRLRLGFRHAGMCVSPEECQLALRGLRSLSCRMERHSRSCLALAAWWQQDPRVAEVYCPALPSSPDHPLWLRDIAQHGGSAGGLFSVRFRPEISLRPVRDALGRLQCFGVGASWGAYQSLAQYFSPRSVRTASNVPEGACVRFFIGLEDPEDLRADMAQAFAEVN